MKPRIVVVDDDDDARDLLWIKLTSPEFGYTVQTFADGISALASITDDPPDLVICDVRMPWMDGLALMRHIHADFPNLPIIMATGLIRESERNAALAAGVTEYVTKPYNLHEFAQIVSRVLGDA